jgi:hypothetical protein
MFFYCNPYWMEEICDTPAELLASRDTAAARRGGLAGSRRKGSGFLHSTGMFLNKKLQANSLFLEFACSLKALRMNGILLHHSIIS